MLHAMEAAEPVADQKMVGGEAVFLFQFVSYYSCPPLTMHSRDSGVNRAASSAFGGRSRRGKGTERDETIPDKNRDKRQMRQAARRRRWVGKR